jgi:dynein light intermediate chain, axonemal
VRHVCFADEVIRQVSLDSPERGLLLHRVRNEALMSIDAYRALFEASIVFGVRKQLQAEEGMPDMEAEAESLKDETVLLEAKVLSLRNRLGVLERRYAERRTLDDRARREELEFLQHQKKHLEAFLKALPGGR